MYMCMIQNVLQVSDTRCTLHDCRQTQTHTQTYKQTDRHTNRETDTCWSSVWLLLSVPLLCVNMFSNPPLPPVERSCCTDNTQPWQIIVINHNVLVTGKERVKKSTPSCQ